MIELHYPDNRINSDFLLICNDCDEGFNPELPDELRKAYMHGEPDNHETCGEWGNHGMSGASFILLNVDDQLKRLERWDNYRKRWESIK